MDYDKNRVDDDYIEYSDYDEDDDHDYDDIFLDGDEIDIYFNRISRAPLRAPVLDVEQYAVEKEKKPEESSVKKKRKQPRIYKSGKDAPAYNHKFDNEEILRLHCEKKSYREIAKILNIGSHHTVKRRIEQIMSEVFE